MVNLILAAVWALAAAMIFALPLLNQDMGPWLIPGTQVSMGWFALVLCAYNLVRWWTTRARTSDHEPLRTLPRPRDYDEEPP